MKKALSLVLVLIMALSLAACGGVSETETTSEISTQPETLVVPNVVGMDKDEAVKLLEGMGFEVEFRVDHWRYNEKANDRYDDGLVLEQDLKQGVVVVPKSVIKITYNSNTDGYSYSELDDGTIMLKRLGMHDRQYEEIYIPNMYEGKVVSKIDAYLLFYIDNSMPNVTIYVPSNVAIEGEPTIAYKTYTPNSN